MSSSVGSWPGSTLEDWLKWLAGKASGYWWVHVRYYWACWIFGTDPRKTVGLKKRDSLKCAGVSQQTLEQRSSLWNWPRMKQEINKLYVHCSIAEHTFMTAQQLLSIIPQLNSTWSHIHVCCQPLLMKPFCKTTVITCHCRDHCGYMTSNNKEDSYQIVLFLFINTARLLCQKLYCLYNTQLPTITNYYHSWSLRPAPQCLAFSSL